MWKYGSLSGITVAGTGIAGSSLQQLNEPTDVVKLGSDSGICIAACTGTTGTQMNQLYAPVSIAFDSTGSLYTSDYHNNRVQKFQFLYNANQAAITTTGQSIATVPTTKITTTTKRRLITTPTNNNQEISASFTISGTTIMACYLIFMTLYYNY
ncbi:unnamed protein product [Adineta steineri]|nr:unnamed protein product [Adineta steineri]